MKNNQKGFIVPILVVIIALLIVGGGAYIVVKNKSSQNPNADTQYNPQINPNMVDNSRTAEELNKTNNTPTQQPVVITLKISSLIPSSGIANDTITVKGSAFNSTSVVLFGNYCTKCDGYSTVKPSSISSDGTSLKFIVPGFATGPKSAFDVRVKNSDGKISAPISFIMNPNVQVITETHQPQVTASTLPAKSIIVNAVNNQGAMNQFRAMYSGTESASDGAQSQSISFWSQEDKQDSRLRYAFYKGTVYQKDSVTKGYFGTIAETMYHFLNNDVSVSCVNTEQFCQAVGNSFAEYFARATASRGMELQSISKLFGLQVYGEPSLMNISNGGAKNVAYDTYISATATTQSSVCDWLNINFSPTEVKKLESPSAQISYTKIDPSQSKFNVNLCVDRTTGLIDAYNTDLTIVTTDGQLQHTASSGTLLGYSKEVAFSNEFPFSSKVEQYNK